MRARPALLVTVLFCLALVSCNGNGTVKGDGMPDSFTTGEVLFLKGEFLGAARSFEEFLVENSRSPYCSDAHYWIGVCALSLNDPEKARRHLSLTNSRPRTKLLEGLSLAALADCDYMEKKFSSAVTRYRHAMGRPGVQRGRVLYRLGMCYTRTGKPQQARLCFQKVVQTVKNAKYVELAKDRLSFTEDGFCVQVGALSTRYKANALRDRLIEKDFSAYIRLVTRGGKSLFCVRIGHFDTWEEANKLVKRIKRARFDAIVIP